MASATHRETRRTIALNLRRLMNERGLSVRRLSAISRISRPAISRLLTNENAAVNLGTVDTLAASLGVQLWRLAAPARVQKDWPDEAAPFSARGVGSALELDD